MKIGIDLGKVVIGRGHEVSDFFTGDHLKTPEIEGARRAIETLLASHHKLYFVSKCDERIEKRTCEWLDRNIEPIIASINQTRIKKGMKISPIKIERHFCRERSKKAGIAEQLGLDCFIDDRAEVISTMRVEHPILFSPREEELDKYRDRLPRGTEIVESWYEVIGLLIEWSEEEG